MNLSLSRLCLIFFFPLLISIPAAAKDIPSGCYRVRFAGIAALFQPSVLLYLQATGQGNYLLRDKKGRFLQVGDELSRSSHPKQASEFFAQSTNGPKLELKSRDGRWLILDQGRLKLSEKDPFPTQYLAGLAQGCTDPEGDLGTTTQAKPGLAGVADLHSHPFANEGFGGALFHGKAFDPLGASVALNSCESDHGLGGIGDVIGNGIDGDMSHGNSGFPSFKSWPAWNDSNHQQMYYRWMERAYRGGLRLLVAHAVNSEALCRFARKADDYSCDDMSAVDRQINAAYALQDYVDAQYGGPGLGWLRIVNSSADARRVIASGKLAMVLGIEVDSLFGCRVGQCDEKSILAALDSYRERGVRHIFPIHVTDNAFGGAALYTPIAFNLANRLQNGEYFSVEDCSVKGFTYQERSFGNAPWTGSLLATNKLLPSYPPYAAHCNARGLTDLGRTLIEALMERGMMIDVDHMSSKTVDAVLSLAETHSYPLISGHTGFVETSAIGQKRSEAQKTDEQLRRLIRLGSVIGPILHQGKVEESVSAGPIPNDCDNSAKSWTQAYSYALSVFRDEGLPPSLGYGSDFNGIIHRTAPRFGDEACSSSKEQAALQKNPVHYPFHSPWVAGDFNRMRAGERIYDINYDGFVHVGLLPDFIEELSAVGMEKADLEPLLHSAEAYLKAWEKAEARAGTLN